jgi:hypothetical protein
MRPHLSASSGEMLRQLALALAGAGHRVPCGFHDRRRPPRRRPDAGLMKETIEVRQLINAVY